RGDHHRFPRRLYRTPGIHHRATAPNTVRSRDGSTVGGDPRAATAPFGPLHPASRRPGDGGPGRLSGGGRPGGRWHDRRFCGPTRRRAGGPRPGGSGVDGDVRPPAGPGPTVNSNGPGKEVKGVQTQDQSVLSHQVTRAPPVTEIMGQPHLWGEFLVLMLSFFLNGIHIRENSVYPAWERSRRAGGGGAGIHYIPHQAIPLFLRLFPSFHIPAPFLTPLPTPSFLCCVALSPLLGPWSPRSTARRGTLPNMPGDASARAPPHLSI